MYACLFSMLCSQVPYQSHTPQQSSQSAFVRVSAPVSVCVRVYVCMGLCVCVSQIPCQSHTTQQGSQSAFVRVSVPVCVCVTDTMSVADSAAELTDGPSNTAHHIRAVSAPVVGPGAMAADALHDTRAAAIPTTFGGLQVCTYLL